MIDTTVLRRSCPYEALPTVCQRQDCAVEIQQPDSFDAGHPMTPVLLHTRSGGEADRLPLETTWLADAHCDIWADHVLPWITGLHENPS